MPCSIPNETVVSVSRRRVILGESTQVTYGFSDDGSADSCAQTLQLAGLSPSGSTSSLVAPVGPATPNASYLSEWTPNAIGLWQVWAYVNYDLTTGYPLDGDGVFPSELQPPFAGAVQIAEVEVVGAHHTEATMGEREPVAGVPGRSADADTQERDGTAGLPSRSVEATLPERDVTAGG